MLYEVMVGLKAFSPPPKHTFYLFRSILSLHK
uniref:Uncharacterized protein n=1 Tax=Siphoviridae sp. cttaA39 TaxID=2827960 RepID=A0A8S5TMU5_9CAUD|nr:MAG TPA: hypothetical protein [Siphoviridae sp. cttaA39]